MPVTDEDVFDHYEKHRDAYDHIQGRLDTTRDVLQTVPDEQLELSLFVADVYSLISTSTAVGAHEKGFATILDDVADPETQVTVDDLSAKLGEVRAVVEGREQAVMYHNNKARYIIHNAREVDYTRQRELFRNEQWDELHRFKSDEVKGLKLPKAAFSMAMCGVTEKYCIDGVLARHYDVVGDMGSPTCVETYEDRADQLIWDNVPEFRESVPDFICQWATWSTIRETLEMHDPWFAGISSVTGENLLTA